MFVTWTKLSKVNKFDIAFQVDGIDYEATIENYTMPGQIRVIDINPIPQGFPSEIIFDKDHIDKKLLYDKSLNCNAVSQIIEAVARTAKEKGIRLYIDDVTT